MAPALAAARRMVRGISVWRALPIRSAISGRIRVSLLDLCSARARCGFAVWVAASVVPALFVTTLCLVRLFLNALAGLAYRFSPALSPRVVGRACSIRRRVYPPWGAVACVVSPSQHRGAREEQTKS